VIFNALMSTFQPGQTASRPAGDDAAEPAF
jgi:hypothetical protein